jgi:DNA-binding response OmpR family regulator
MIQATILIIDDEPVFNDLVEIMLLRAGFLALKSDNGADGLHLATAKRPDLVLLDDMMPGMHGYEVLAAIKARQLPTRAIMMTAQTISPDLIVVLIRAGACDFIQKPFSQDELVAAIRRALATESTIVGDPIPIVEKLLDALEEERRGISDERVD